MNIVPKIKQLCNEKGVSISEFEREIGISENSSWRWDKNSPSIDKVVRAANYFGVSIGYLSGQDDAFVLARKKKDEKTPAPPTENGLSAEQKALMDLYDALAPADRAVLIATARALAEAHKSQGNP